MAKIIDGKAIAAKIRGDIGAQTAKLKEKGVVPGLAVVLVGEDAASKVYVAMKEKALRKLRHPTRSRKLKNFLAMGAGD